MSHHSLFVLRYNGRDDNLGDQFIVKALVEALHPLGEVAFYGKSPAWLPDVRVVSNRPALLALLVQRRATGHRVLHFAPPGARLGGASPRRRKLPRLSLGTRVALGLSVLPSANNDWCHNYDWVGVRDNTSVRTLQAAGLEAVEYFPDLAFLTENPTGSNEPRANICLSFREILPEDVAHESTRHDLFSAIETLKTSCEADSSTQLVTFHQVEEDAPFAEEIANAFGGECHQDKLTLTNHKAFYQSARLVVSNRLHCLLMGALAGAVPVALTSRNHTKLVSLFQTVGWESLLLFIEDDHDLASRFTTILNRQEANERLVRETCEKQRKLAIEILNQLAG